MLDSLLEKSAEALVWGIDHTPHQIPGVKDCGCAERAAKMRAMVVDYMQKRTVSANSQRDKAAYEAAAQGGYLQPKVSEMIRANWPTNPNTEAQNGERTL